MSSSRPDWWSWDLEFSLHALRRMLDRGLTELGVRGMLSGPSRLEPDPIAGRWRVRVRRQGMDWTVLGEPDPLQQVLVVVTVCATGRSSP